MCSFAHGDNGLSFLFGGASSGMLNVAFVSSEIMPYASTGGLADVCRALPAALQDAGVGITQFMPLYRRVMEGHYPLEDTGIRLSIPVGFHRYQADIWRLTRKKLPIIYFIRRDEFFDRTELYNLPERDYDDNFERFIFFQKAVVALIDHLGRPFDIVHGHDWQTGLLPLYLRHGLSGEGRTMKEKTVFTIHNLAYQGIFGGDNFSYTNLPFSTFSVDCLEYYGNVNSLKGGITSSDLVTTVSENYAREIQTEEWGCGLHGVLGAARHRLTGIANGIDVEAWDPAHDPHIAHPYNASDIAGKIECKKDLIRRMKLSKAAINTPLLGMVTRLTEQKGIDLVDKAIDEIMTWPDVAIAILGAGEDAFISCVQGWTVRYPGRISAKFGFDAKLARRIIAGCDLFLMPSKFEPCGLNQLYALRYGSLPVVHRVGGLADTITGLETNPEDGVGFVFDHFTEESFLRSLKRAIQFYADHEKWSRVMERAMKQDHCWTKAAAMYVDQYLRLVHLR